MWEWFWKGRLSHVENPLEFTWVSATPSVNHVMSVKCNWDSKHSIISCTFTFNVHTYVYIPVRGGAVMGEGRDSVLLQHTNTSTLAWWLPRIQMGGFVHSYSMPPRWNETTCCPTVPVSTVWGEPLLVWHMSTWITMDWSMYAGNKVSMNNWRYSCPERGKCFVGVNKQCSIRKCRDTYFNLMWDIPKHVTCMSVYREVGSYCVQAKVWFV